MNLKRLLTFGALTMFSASIATGQGTAPTIVQGDYISNVFGNSNFIKNPNAKLNTKDVTFTGSQVSRSATTPLVATSEFNLSLLQNANATWDLRTFDSGMKGQNCEARFTYRGFATATSTAQILQGANVVAQLVLTASTDPRIASINFPCGDLSTATSFRLSQTTANMTGTNELGGIYVGLATNMANVAQAENVVQASRITTVQTIPNAVDTTIIFNNEALDSYGEFDTSTGIFTAKRAGYYFASAQYRTAFVSWAAGGTNYAQISLVKNGSTSVQLSYLIADAAISKSFFPQVSSGVFLAVGDTLRVNAYITRGTNTDINVATGETNFQIYRFPSSSELVVTPETQNVWGEISGTGVDSTTTSTSYVTPSGFTLYANGKCMTDGTNMACKISTLPPGSYKVDVSMPYFAAAGGSAGQNCFVQIVDNKGAIDAPTAQAASNTSQNDGISSVSRLFKYSSVQTDVIFSVKHKQIAGGAGGVCGVYTTGGKYFEMTVTPLDQPSNSALYVEGPVKASATGAAIPSGYQHESKLCGGSRNFVNNTAGGTGWSLFQAVSAGCTLTPGIYLVRWTITMSQTSGTSTGQRVGILTTDSADGWAPTSNLSQGNANFTNLTLAGVDSRTGVSVVTVTPSGIVGGTGFVLYGKVFTTTHTTFTGDYYFDAVIVRLN